MPPGEVRPLSSALPSHRRRWAVLTGGGAAFWWQAGVLHGLQEAGITFDRYAGTSAGALVAATAAAGRLRVIRSLVGTLSGSDLWGRPPGLSLLGLLRIKRAWDLGGLLGRKKLEQLVARTLPDRSIRAIAPDALRVHVVDVASGCTQYVATEQLPPKLLRRAILASAAIPGLFAPVDLQVGSRLIQGIDGGIVNNTPLEDVVSLAEHERDTWELWLISAVGTPETGAAVDAKDLAERIVQAHLERERRTSIDYAERRGWVRGRTLRVVQMGNLPIDLVEFTRRQSEVAWLAGTIAGRKEAM